MKIHSKTSVSIVIPVLNEERFINKLLRLLSKQTHKNFEIIVVDGKSRDKTLKVIKNFKTRNKNISLRLIRASHKGVSFQRNIGANAANNELLLFLDADVSFDKMFLERILSEFNLRKFGIASTQIFPTDGNLIDTLLSHLYHKYQIITKDISPVVYGMVILVKKSLHSRVKGFDETLFFFEDSDYVKRIVKKGGKFQILKLAKLYSSPRRVKKEGRIAFEVKMIRYFVYYLLFGKYFAQTKIIYNK